MRTCFSIVAVVMALGVSGQVYPVDPNTPKTCNDWFSNAGVYPCFSIPTEFGITKEQFLEWVSVDRSIFPSDGEMLS